MAASSVEASIEHLVQVVDVGRCVGVKIINKTQSVTLQNPRSYCSRGHVHFPLPLQIPPGATGTGVFGKSWLGMSGCEGILLYNVGKSTLVILFSNPFNYIFSQIEFGLKLIPDSSELLPLPDILNSMQNDIPSQGLAIFQKMKLANHQVPLKVVLGDICITATMSNTARSILTVLVENGKPQKSQH